MEQTITNARIGRVSGYTESQCVDHIRTRRNMRVDTEHRIIKVLIDAVLDKKTRGKTDFLVHYCKYGLVYQESFHD
jgi:hypothetical protein